MNPQSVLAKTDKGTREIETRENKLDHRLRALLIMVNGRATAEEISKKFEQLGDVMPMLKQLIAQGFVVEQGAAAIPARAPSPVATGGGGGGDLKSAQRELCKLLSASLGPDADAITGRVEACSSMDELRAFFQARRDMLTQALGKQRSPAFWAKADPFLK